MNITELLDLLSVSTGMWWAEVSDELLAEGYSWEYSAAADCYRLKDLSAYFA